jgi:excisionase family DNA binding protein
MSEILLSSIPLAQLEQSIAKIIEEKLQAYLLNLPSQKSSKKYATREEVAKLLHITLPTLNQLTKSGALTAYRIGGRVLYDIAEVESSLNEIVTTKYKRRA